MTHLECGVQPASSLCGGDNGGELFAGARVVQRRVRQVVRHALEALQHTNVLHCILCSAELRILLKWRDSVLHAEVRKRCSSVGILLPGMPLECGTTTAAAQTGTLTIWLAVMSDDSASVASSVISATFCPGSYTNSM